MFDDLIRWFEDRNSYLFSKNKRYPNVLYENRTGDIFYDSGKTLEEFNSIKSLLKEVHDKFEYGDYNISEIISYHRKERLKEIGI